MQLDCLRIVVKDGRVLTNSRGGVVQLVVPLIKGMFAHPGITSNEEVHMPAISLVFPTSFPARCFLGVILRMAIISYRIPAVSW